MHASFSRWIQSFISGARNESAELFPAQDSGKTSEHSDPFFADPFYETYKDRERKEQKKTERGFDRIPGRMYHDIES